MVNSIDKVTVFRFKQIKKVKKDSIITVNIQLKLKFMEDIKVEYIAVA